MKKIIKYRIPLLILFLLAPQLFAQEDFKGLGFGVGLSLTVDTGDNDRVNSASVVNGIVRVDEEDDTLARIMLESHYFFTPKGHFFKVKPNNWGHGPFVAVQPGTDIIEAVALGWMIGFKRECELPKAECKSKNTDSWNIGLGYAVDPNAKILGEGIKDNQPLPSGETEVRFREKSQGGILLLTSFSW